MNRNKPLTFTCEMSAPGAAGTSRQVRSENEMTSHVVHSSLRMKHRSTPTARSLTSRFAPAAVVVSLLALMACSSGSDRANHDGAPDTGAPNQDGAQPVDGAPDAA